ncbi:hypothetical protein AOLI_G00080600 [Acnodon oligacanthus]
MIDPCFYGFYFASSVINSLGLNWPPQCEGSVCIAGDEEHNAGNHCLQTRGSEDTRRPTAQKMKPRASSVMSSGTNTMRESKHGFVHFLPASLSSLLTSNGML